jgi:hypothetical protein
MMEKELRKSGIHTIGDIPWDTHLCLFYQTREDLFDILIPYFKAGLESEELCLWITSQPLDKDHIQKVMRKCITDFDRYVKKGQMALIPYNEWYLQSGTLDLPRANHNWIEIYNQALAKGYEGMRISVNTTWLKKRDWPRFTKYVNTINSNIGKQKMLSIGTYFLDRYEAPEIIDVVSNHQFALIKRNGKWDTIPRYRHKQMEHNIDKHMRELRCLYDVANITGEPDITLYERYHKIATLLPKAWRYPDIAFARIVIDDREFTTANYRQTDWKQSSDIIVHGARAGTVEVGYLEARPQIDEGPFAIAERLLLDAVAERLGIITEHRQT